MEKKPISPQMIISTNKINLQYELLISINDMYIDQNVNCYKWILFFIFKSTVM